MRQNTPKRSNMKKIRKVSIRLLAFVLAIVMMAGTGVCVSADDSVQNAAANSASVKSIISASSAATGSITQTKGKVKIAFFGDSITYGTDGAVHAATGKITRVAKPFPDVVASYLNAECVNYGMGSIGLFGLIQETAYDKVSKTDLSSYGVAVLCYGVNDKGHPLGSYKSTDTTTLIGRYRKLVNYLKKKYPKLKILIITPWNTGKTDRSAHGRAIKKMADSMGVACIEQTDGPLPFSVSSKVLPDAVHPTQEYYNKIGYWVAEKLNSLCQVPKKKTALGQVRTEFKSVVYTGKIKNQTITVKDVNGNILKENEDYTLSFKNSINTGTATVTATGKGWYTGTVSTTYKIRSRSLSSCADVTVKESDLLYDGKAKDVNLVVTAKIVKKKYTLKEGKDYKLTYKDNVKPGIATVTITGIGNYEGSIKTTFTIRPRAVDVSVSKIKTSSVELGWPTRKCPPSGYEIQYSRSKDFSKKTKAIDIQNPNAVMGLIYGLDSNTTIYIRVRCYTKSGKTMIYSVWSPTICCTTKRQSYTAKVQNNQNSENK